MFGGRILDVPPFFSSLYTTSIYTLMSIVQSLCTPFLELLYHIVHSVHCTWTGIIVINLTKAPLYSLYFFHYFSGRVEFPPPPYHQCCLTNTIIVNSIQRLIPACSTFRQKLGIYTLLIGSKVFSSHAALFIESGEKVSILCARAYTDGCCICRAGRNVARARYYAGARMDYTV